MKKQVKKAVILAAGFGTRFLPVTKSIPKEMFPIIDVPAMQYLVNEAVNSGIKEILIIISRNKKMITDHFDKAVELELQLKNTGKLDALKVLDDIIPKDVKIYYHIQKEMQGTAKAVELAKSFTNDEPFVLFFGDDLIYTGNDATCSEQLIECYEKTGETILATQYVPDKDASKYGLVLCEETDAKMRKANKMVEKPNYPVHNPMVSIGRFLLTADVFDYITKIDKKLNGESYLSDAFDLMAHDGKIYACQYEGKRYDLGDKLGYVKATIEYALRREDMNAELTSYLKDLVK